MPEFVQAKATGIAAQYSQQEKNLHRGVDFQIDIGLNTANKNDQRET